MEGEEAVSSQLLAEVIVDDLLNEHDIDNATHGNYDAETFRIRLRDVWVKRVATVLYGKNPLQDQLLDLITLMPDSQTQEIIDYIMSLREIRARRDA